ncbi:MAG TPA: nitroreductase/quinone reductase family protein [Dehalococcoidia bacterium]
MPSRTSSCIRGIFYSRGRPTRAGRFANRITGWWSAMGLPPAIQASLETRGRRSGGTRTCPIVIATVDGERYLVSMLGSKSEWVMNVRANDGKARLKKGRRERIRLVEVPPEERAPVLREYVRIATSGRLHFPLQVGAPLSEYAAISGRYPVFRIESR